MPGQMGAPKGAPRPGGAPRAPKSRPPAWKIFFNPFLTVFGAPRRGAPGVSWPMPGQRGVFLAPPGGGSWPLCLARWAPRRAPRALEGRPRTPNPGRQRGIFFDPFLTLFGAPRRGAPGVSAPMPRQRGAFLARGGGFRATLPRHYCHPCKWDAFCPPSSWGGHFPRVGIERMCHRKLFRALTRSLAASDRHCAA